MLSKCANPGCFAPFLYLHQGKLFRLDMEIGGVEGQLLGADAAPKQTTRRIEFFWLCDDCAANMTLIFKKGAGVATKPLPVVRKAAS
jgi:hypothetical protein